MNYLPSKKIFISIILLIILVGGVFWITERGKNTVGLNNGSQSVVENSKKDSDGDGLADWEEALWGTDPKNPDSDGNGIPDGEEIRLLKEDELAQLNFITEGTLSGSGDETTSGGLNRTGSFAIDFFSRYLNAKDGGAGVLSESESIAIQEGVVGSFFIDLKSSQSLPKFLSKDIATVEASLSNIKEYGNSVGEVVSKYEDKSNFGSPEEIFIEALKTKDDTKADDLKILAQDYILAAEEMAKIPTPKNILSLHLSLVNNLTNIGEIVSVLGDIFVDPLSSLGVISSYQEEVLLLSNLAKDLREYLISNNVLYSPQESGYILINNI